MEIIKLDKIYEGKAKILYSTNNNEYLIQHFKNDITAFNNKKKENLVDKGYLNNVISEFLMNEIKKHGVENHFIKRLNENEQLIKSLKIIPLEVIIRNVAAGSLSKNLALKEGEKFDNPIFEICYKKDELNDPLINDDHAVKVLKLVSSEELEKIKEKAKKINNILIQIFKNISIILVDFKIEFGFDSQGNIILADEVSPDSCRLWDEETNEKLDKDVFRKDLGNVVEAYKKLAKRLKLI